MWCGGCLSSSYTCPFLDLQVRMSILARMSLITFYSSTVFSEDKVTILPNSLDDNLFDASVVTTVDEEDIASHDVMTCDVRLADGGFEERVEKSILKKKGDQKKNISCIYHIEYP